MLCSKCGADVPDGLRFCDLCGAPMQVVTQAKKYDIDTYDMAAGGGFEAGNAKELEWLKDAAPRRSNKKWFVLGGSVLAVVAIVLLAVFWLIPMLTKGPTEKIVDAFIETTNSESMSVKFGVDTEKLDISGKFKMEYSIKDKFANIYMNMSMQGMTFDVYIIIDEDGGHAAVKNPMTGTYQASEVMGKSEAKDFFDSIESASRDRDEMFEGVAEYLAETTGKGIDEDKFVDAANKMLKELDKQSNLDKLFSYEKEKEDGVIIHKFDPDVYQLAKTVLPIFEDAFEKTDYEVLEEQLEKNKKSMKDMKADVEIGLDGGDLASVLVKTEGMKVEIEISDVNKTTVKMDKDAEAAIKAAK